MIFNFFCRIKCTGGVKLMGSRGYFHWPCSDFTEILVRNQGARIVCSESRMIGQPLFLTFLWCWVMLPAKIYVFFHTFLPVIGLLSGRPTKISVISQDNSESKFPSLCSVTLNPFKTVPALMSWVHCKWFASCSTDNNHAFFNSACLTGGGGHWRW